jgi:serine/threonine protein kinase/WD40 repeat protein
MADDLLLDRLAGEFTQRVREGKLPDIEEFANRYPQLADRIRELFPTLMLLEGLAASGPPAVELRPSPLSEGSIFGNYRIEREIGRGGMGIVYEAVHALLEKRVALKVLPVRTPAGPEYLERFFREARTAAGLHHTNIVPVFDVGQVAGTSYFAMQYIEGRSLDRILRTMQSAEEDISGELASDRTSSRTSDMPVSLSSEITSPRSRETRRAQIRSCRLGRIRAGLPGRSNEYFRWVAGIGIQAAEGIAYAHERKVVHRDIKPSNLLLDNEGVLRIADFGLARKIEDPALTQSGTLIGTPRYMSPEQADAARRPVDQRSDIYSLGATLYELLTCRPVFEGKTPQEVLIQIIGREPVAPRKLNTTVPQDLETIVLKAMAKRPGDRYQSAGQLADDLRHWLKLEPIHARRIGPIGRTSRWCRRNPRLATVTAAAAAIILTLSVIYYAGLVKENAKTHMALRSETKARERTAAALRQAEASRLQAEAARGQAQNAQRLSEERRNMAQIQLARSLYEQSRALRLAGQNGRRPQVLDLLKEAGKLRRQLQAAAGLRTDPQSRMISSLPSLLELRNEAVTSLLLMDSRVVQELPVENEPPNRMLASDFRSDNTLAVRRLITGPTNRGWRVFDYASGREVARLEGKARFYRDPSIAAVSRDGALMAALDTEGLSLFVLPSGRLRKLLKLPNDSEAVLQGGGSTEFNSLAFGSIDISPDNRYIAASESYGAPWARTSRILLWDLQEEADPRVLGSSTSSIPSSVSFDPLGRYVAFASSDSTVMIVDLSNSERTVEINLLGPGTISRGKLVFNQQGNLLAVPLSNKVMIWDRMANSWRSVLQTESIESGSSRAIAFSPDGSLLAVSLDSAIGIFDLTRKTEIYRLPKAHLRSISQLHWQLDGKHLFSCSDIGLDGIKRWELFLDSLAANIGGLGEKFFGVSSTGRWLPMIMGTSISLIDVRTGLEEKRFPLTEAEREDSVNVLLSPDDQKMGIYTVHAARLVDLTTGLEIASRRMGIGSAAFSSAGRFLLMTFAQPKDVYDIESGRVVWSAPTSTALFSGIGSRRAAWNAPGSTTFFLEGGRFIIGRYPRIIPSRRQYLVTTVVWESGGFREIARFGRSGWPSTVSNDGTCLVTTFSNGFPFIPRSSEDSVAAWDLRSGKKRFGIRISLSRSMPTVSCVISPDSRALALGYTDGSVRFFDLRTGVELFEWQTPLGNISRLSFGPDGKFICAQDPQSPSQILDLGRLSGELTKLGLDW